MKSKDDRATLLGGLCWSSIRGGEGNVATLQLDLTQKGNLVLYHGKYVISMMSDVISFKFTLLSIPPYRLMELFFFLFKTERYL